MSTTLLSPIMAATESFSRSPFDMPKPIPILSESHDPMEVTPSSASMPPPNDKDNIDKDSIDKSKRSESESPKANDDSNSSQSGNASAAANQPQKVYQTAFIHKLYNMLEDTSIQHLICWSKNNESFVMSPSQEFSKVLAQYFKHTNISSFVRQLNMYGFHKISDVFHNGAPDNTLWEFRHGNGSFKRGDLNSLKEIKRRASRHTLIHRESFSTNPKPMPPAPPLPQTAEILPDPADRFSVLEHFVQGINDRICKTDDTVSYLKGRCQMLSDGLTKSYQFNRELIDIVFSVVPDADHALQRKISSMRSEISRQYDTYRNGGPSDYSPSSASSYNYLHENHAIPLSPRQMPLESTQRRPSIQFESRSNIPAHIAISPRRAYGSFGSSSNPYSPSSQRPALPPSTPNHTSNNPQPSALSIPQPPLSAVSNSSGPFSPNLSRRHTAADIRSHGWNDANPPPPPPLPSPFTSSPLRATENSSSIPDKSISSLRDQLASYDMKRTQPSITTSIATPPPHSTNFDPNLAAIAGTGPESGWAIPAPSSSGFSSNPKVGMLGGISNGGSMPGTRRSSMAAIQGLLNPEHSVEEEKDVGDEGGGKRKRI